MDAQNPPQRYFIAELLLVALLKNQNELMNLQPTLQNEIVQIRPLTQDDFEGLYKAANDPKIWEQHPCKRNKRDEFEKFFTESINSNGALAILDLTTDTIIGSSRYRLTEGFANGIEIGWTFLTRDYWGGKYNATVKQLMIKHAFKNVDHVLLYIAKENIRSQKAAEKIGGQLLGLSERPEIPRKSSEHLIFVVQKKNID